MVILQKSLGKGFGFGVIAKLNPEAHGVLHPGAVHHVQRVPLPAYVTSEFCFSFWLGRGLEGDTECRVFQHKSFWVNLKASAAHLCSL